MIINCFLCRMRAASSIVRFLVLLSAASALDPTPRVAGGSQAIDGDFSYFGKLRIQLSNGLYTSCGGTLISPTAVLTAAHCISGDDVVSVNVEFGRVSKDDTSSEDVDVESFEIHPEFSTTTRLNDIAVLRLVKAVSIPPANVPFDKEEEDLVPNTGQDVTVVGFGATTGGGLGSDKLLEISINVQNTGNCDVFKFGMDNDSQFCAGGDGKVPCKGDSGGPAVMAPGGVAADLVVGVVSYGGTDCYSHPAVFTRVSGFEDFITEEVCHGAGQASWCPAEIQFLSADVGCFSGSSLVEVADDRGAVRMKDLRLGDEVLVGDGVYEPIYSFGHRGRDTKASFLRITTEQSKVVLTSNHMLFSRSRRSAVPASLLQVGEELIDAFGHSDRILAIKNVQERGVYAPFTPSGQIVVNNILASTYIAMEETERLGGGSWLSLSHQWLAHTAQFPHRLVCYHLKSCSTEEYTREGISLWVSKPLQWSKWLMFESEHKRLFLTCSVGLFAALLSIVEICCLQPLLLLATVTVLAARYRRRKLV